MWPNLQFSGDLVTFTGEDLENFIFCLVNVILGMIFWVSNIFWSYINVMVVK